MALSPRAYNTLPERFEDQRHRAIVAGWLRKGYQVVDGYGAPRSPADVLLTWTVHKGAKEKTRDMFEAGGGRVAVYEESYIKMPRGEKHIAVSWHDHNGAGRIPYGGRERWRSWGIELRPWREPSAIGHILVREQRGIGSRLQACPPSWHQTTAAALRKLTRREIRIRLHPKHDPDPTPDSERFRGCHALVTWNSSMAADALVRGIPVITMAPHSIVDLAAGHRLEEINSPFMGTRLPMFERIAWGQWSLDELRNGDPVDYLLSVA